MAEKKAKKEEKLNGKIAVIKLGGNQHLVKPGTELEVNRLDSKEGSKNKLDALVLRPKITKGSVTYRVLEHKRGPKLHVMTYKAKSRYRRKKGFRASLSKVKVETITVGK